MWEFGEGRSAVPSVDADTVLVVDVWVFDHSLSQVLLVRHRDRGWVMPGGTVESGESLRAAAARELEEETGLSLPAEQLRPAAVHSGRRDGVLRLGMSYDLVVDPALPLRPEVGQPAAWWALGDRWTSVYPHDRARLLRHVDHLGSGHST